MADCEKKNKNYPLNNYNEYKNNRKSYKFGKSFCHNTLQKIYNSHYSY